MCWSVSKGHCVKFHNFHLFTMLSMIDLYGLSCLNRYIRAECHDFKPTLQRAQFSLKMTAPPPASFHRCGDGLGVALWTLEGYVVLLPGPVWRV